MLGEHYTLRVSLDPSHIPQMLSSERVALATRSLLKLVYRFQVYRLFNCYQLLLDSTNQICEDSAYIP